jgi:type VI secretion system secreted protein Hcp
MAYDAFLKIDGIAGESLDERHKDEIEVLAFSWGESNSGSSGIGGGGGAGKVTMQDFRFTMKLSKASPQLAAACATGKHIKSAVLTCRKAGGDVGAVGGDAVGVSALPTVVEVPGGVDVVAAPEPDVVVANDGFIKFTLSDLLVTSYQTSVAPPSAASGQVGLDLPIDTILIDFGKVVIVATSQRADGSPGASVRGGFDLRSGKAV